MIPYFFDDAVLGIIKYGDYRDWNGDKFTRHIGFYVEFSDIKHKNTEPHSIRLSFHFIFLNIYLFI